MDFTFLEGDARDILPQLPESIADCVVTSPPYFGLRDYGIAGQIGMEGQVNDYVQSLVHVFRLVRRVLRDDGTLWLNLGDSYARAGGWSDNSGLDGLKRGKSGRDKSNMQNGANGQRLPDGLKSKDLIGVPWRVALALQADGWYLRSDIIWQKPNPMPEAVKDRPTKSHEYIFLLTKNEKYYYDADSIREPHADDWHKRASTWRDGKAKQQQRGDSYHTYKEAKPFSNPPNPLGRNKRSVWSVTTKPFKGAHFAVFPPDLIEPCVLAGSRPGGLVLDPFSGAATSGLVALRNGRSYLGIELNPEYIELSKERLKEYGQASNGLPARQESRPRIN